MLSEYICAVIKLSLISLPMAFNQAYIAAVAKSFSLERFISCNSFS